MPVGGSGALGIAEERGPRGLLRRQAVVDRAVANVVPGDEPGNPRPGRVARDEVHLGEEWWPLTPAELATLQGHQGVLVGHGRHAEARAAIAEVAAAADTGTVGESRALPPPPGGFG